MRIAVNYGEKGRVFQHFGHTEMFRIYEINDENQVSKIDMLATNGVTCCALANLLHDNNIDVVICGGIGQNAINNLNSFNIKVVNGVDDDCDIAVAKFLADKLNFSLTANCSHEQDQVQRHSCHSHEDCDDCNECENTTL